MTPSEQKIKLYDLCKKFVKDQTIWGPECVYQSDRVIENAYVFIAEICDVVGYEPLPDEEDDE